MVVNDSKHLSGILTKGIRAFHWKDTAILKYTKFTNIQIQMRQYLPHDQNIVKNRPKRLYHVRNEVSLSKDGIKRIQLFNKYHNYRSVQERVYNLFINY